MGFNNEDVPDIPLAPQLPNLPREHKKELPELPSFPNSPFHENFNQQIVKSAVDDLHDDLYSSEDNEVMVEELPRDFHHEMIPLLPAKPMQNNQIFPQNQAINQMQILKPAQPDSVFVRIDKFQSAQNDFEDIKSKVKEVNLLLKRIKEVKAREDAEISEWINNIEQIKEKLSQIDENIFNKI